MHDSWRKFSAAGTPLKFKGILYFLSKFSADKIRHPLTCKKARKGISARRKTDCARHPALADHGGFRRVIQNVAINIDAKMLIKLRVTPAMAAGLTDKLWSWEDVIALMDAANPPKKRGAYKKKAA